MAVGIVFTGIMMVTEKTGPWGANIILSKKDFQV
jgi:hypothetical protein